MGKGEQMARGSSTSRNSGSTSGRSRAKSSGSKSRSRSTRRDSGGSSSRKPANGSVPDYSIIDPEKIDDAVDVYFDAPVVQVEEIKFEMDDLRAHIAVLAEAGRFVQLN